MKIEADVLAWFQKRIRAKAEEFKTRVMMDDLAGPNGSHSVDWYRGAYNGILELDLSVIEEIAEAQNAEEKERLERDVDKNVKTIVTWMPGQPLSPPEP